MAHKLKAGTKNSTQPIQYSGSMAHAMEKAFMEEWEHIMGSGKPEMNDQVRLLFIAVAQGVIRHLVDNKRAFKIDIPSSTSGTSSEVSVKRIDTEGLLYP